MQLSPSCGQNAYPRGSATCEGMNHTPRRMYETVGVKSVNDDLLQRSLQQESPPLRSSSFLSGYRGDRKFYFSNARPISLRRVRSIIASNVARSGGNIVVASLGRGECKVSRFSSGFSSLMLRASILATACQVGEDCASRGNHAPQ